MKQLIATLACAAVVLGSVLGGVAGADSKLTYYFYKCGKVKAFYAVKQESGSGSFKLVGSTQTFVVKKAVVLGDQTVGGTFYADGTVLFDTPGFSGTKTDPAVTCTSLSPESGILARVTGSFSK